MKASIENPIYSAYVVSGNTKYNITGVVCKYDFSDQEKQMAQCVTITLVNVKIKGSKLADIIKVRDRVYVYANDGTKNAEVFRGYVWTNGYQSDLQGKEITLKCYDNLIYFQKSEDLAYFSSGKSTKAIISSLCSKWGVKLSYSYSSITHSKLALRGYLSDIFTADILDKVKDRTGKKYVILSEKDVMIVRPVGANTTIYALVSGKNAEIAKRECSMDDVVTKVVILGKADKNDRQPVEATVKSKTSEYGTLQRLINRNEGTSLSEAKKEAQSILKEDGAPKWEYAYRGPDIPWIRKGDKIQSKADDVVSGYLIVTSVERSITNDKKEMTLTLEKP